MHSSTTIFPISFSVIQVDIDQIIKDFAQRGEDFNDQLITEIAKDQGLKLRWESWRIRSDPFHSLKS